MEDLQLGDNVLEVRATMMVVNVCRFEKLKSSLIGSFSTDIEARALHPGKLISRPFSRGDNPNYCF